MTDPAFDGLAVPSGGPPALTAGAPLDAGTADAGDPAFDGLEVPSTPGAGGGAPAPGHPAVHHAKATAPVDNTDYANMPWMDVGSRAVHNFIPSAESLVGGVGKAIMHPIDTLSGVGSIAKGALAKTGLVQADPHDQAMLDAFTQHYKDAYGSVGGFKKALATDPASVAMDVSLPLTLGGDAVGMAGGTLGKVGDAVSTAGKMIDPVQAALAVAKKGAGVGDKALRGMQGLVTGVSPNDLKLARDAGASSDPAIRQAFLTPFMGRIDPTAIAQQAQQALKEIKGNVSQDYLNTKAGIMASSTPLSFMKVQQGINDARNAIAPHGVTSAFGPANAALTQAETMANDFHAAAPTLENYDRLKQAIWDLHEQTGNAEAQKTLMKVYDGVKQTIVDRDPAYAKLMDDYQTGINNITNLTKTFGLSNNSAASSALLKMLRANRVGGDRASLLDQLSSTPSGQYLPYTLAGAALHPLQPDGLRRIMEYGSLFHVVNHDPISFVGQLAASSPKANGLAQFTAGAAGRPLSQLQRPSATYTLARYGDSQDEDATGAPAGVPTGTPTGGQDQGLPEGMPTDDPTGWDRSKYLESRGHQFDAKGRPLISSAGAVGVAQVMPTTGPTAARLAGLPWDEHRLYYDKNYNEALGHALWLTHLKDFGSPILAAAAYSAGPGRVRQAMNSARRYGGDWSDYVPAETQHYITHFRDMPTRMAASGGRIERKAGGRAEVIDHGGEAERLIRAAEKAKSHEGNSTEALLNVPDEKIVSALADAKEAF